MARIFEADGWRDYKMTLNDPHRELEPLDREIAVIDDALAALVEAGVLPHTDYDKEKMLAHRSAVREHFDIPWTAISPRMQRLMYAVNAIAQPEVMVAVGIFCGNTFISHAGAAVGPGACYEARRLVGLEIRPEEADRARRNVSKIDPEGRSEIIAADGIAWLSECEDTIDLLYLDADGAGGRGKGIYLDLLKAAQRALRPGSLVLAHNSVNSARSLADYLEHVRDTSHFRESVNMIVDDQGLEVSVR
jgi:predicted O-methyltransferase YrrM